MVPGANIFYDGQEYVEGVTLSAMEAYQLIEKFEVLGYSFTSVKRDQIKRLRYSFPLLLSKFERKPNGFNPEIPVWHRGITMRTKLISITMSPMLYIIGAPLIVKIPHLLEGLSISWGFVSFLYGLTVFILFDGGLYFLFGISIVVLIAKQLAKISSQSHSSDNV